MLKTFDQARFRPRVDQPNHAHNPDQQQLIPLDHIAAILARDPALREQFLKSLQERSHV